MSFFPGKDPAAAELLKTMKMRRFERVDSDLLARLQERYAQAGGGGSERLPGFSPGSP